MSRKIRKLSLAILLIVILGIGGKVYMDKREAQRQKDLLAVEKQSVKVLKNTFADIKEVKIEKSARNEMTGAYRMFVTMINNHDESVYFTFGFWKERNELGDYGVENKSIQKEGIWFFQWYLYSMASLKTYQYVRVRLFEKLHTLGMRYFDQTPAGSTVSRVTNDTETLFEFWYVFLMVLTGIFDAGDGCSANQER
ncbi:hypothetical protein EfmAA610_21190 [Enterococcus faecium]|nr:hypothetical protein EfmAA610_21190 [Enterococcus faecium]